MEQKIHSFSPDILLEEYRQLLNDESIEALPLLISGNSMSPFLIHGRDTVYLSRLTRPVRQGDVLLYQRDNGAYILHRVYQTSGDSFTMVGDVQTELEPGIRPEQVIAIMTSAMRKGKVEAPGTFWWEFFSTIWLRVLPFRPTIQKTYTAISKLLKR